MSKNLVITITGPDRVGIVEDVTSKLLHHGGNVGTSRMARLGGIFSIIMMVSLPEDRYDDFMAASKNLLDDDYSITVNPTEISERKEYTGWIPYQIKLNGADHEGIIHQVAQCLVQHSINIESLDTDSVSAPVSGTQIFTMNAMVLVPPNLTLHSLQNEMESLERDLNVDIEVSPFVG